jgi:tetratricopeptide (TPR) repeat protein
MQSLEAFKFDAGEGRISAAATELQTAFIGNEFHPGLQGLNRTEKQRVGDYLAKIDVLKNQLESRVFEEVPGQLASIQKLATDFDATKPLALVNGVKLESELRLGKAKLLAQQGELTDAMKEFSNAAEEWPGNPDLQTASKTFFGTEDSVHQNTDDFDRDFNAGNFRDITAKAVQYGAAVHGDPTREQQLSDAITKVQKAEAAETEANMRVMNGDVDGAWETIESAVKTWPEDVKLNQMLASLSSRCADFVSAIDKARDAQAKKEYGYSLTWYVNALSYYPASTIANGGVDDVSKVILAGSKDTASTQD